MKWSIVMLIVSGICCVIYAIYAIISHVRLVRKIKESEDERKFNQKTDTNNIANSTEVLQDADETSAEDKKPDFKLTNSMLR